jgi:beta-aspartyl-peptidase (threonine type)
VIIVHGGAKTIPIEQHEAHREGCRRAAEAGWEVLAAGGSALDAAVTAIRALEADPTFNAGYGADLNIDGEVQLDAGLIEGTELRAGAVAFVQGVRHPISLARAILEDGEVLMAGDGAYLFAKEKGVELCPKEALITAERLQEWEEKAGGSENDTVGCVALDSEGRLAAGASTGGTGGTGGNRRGRVGDSPQLGCGFYADDELGGCSMTGDGEQIARVVLAKRVVDSLGGSKVPDEVMRDALRHLERRTQGEAGGIVLDRHGLIGWEHNSDHMAVAFRNEAMASADAFISKEEEWEKKSA